MNGWLMKKWTKGSASIVLITLYVSPGYLENVYADTEESPSMELLEFLGEWQTQEGDWIDPMAFIDAENEESQRSEEDQKDD